MHLKHKMAAAILAALAMAASSAADAASRTGSSTQASASQGLMASPDCDPFSDWDSDVGTTDDLLPEQHGSPTHGRVATMRGAAAQIIGTTPEAIHRNFLKVVTQNLANAGTSTRVARLSDRELAAIARHAAQGAPAERAGLLKLFATRLDARALVRIARAFGRAPTEAAVRAYAGKATRDAFEGEIAGIMAPPEDDGGGGTGTGTGGTTSYPSPSPPRPTVDMTLEEIYLEYRTAPIGSLSPAGALAETAQFAGVRLSFWFTVGTGIGTGISWLLEHYAPDVNDAIGGTISNMIENFWEASGQIEEGQFEAAIDQVLGFPVTGSSDPWGDWDIDTPMVDYYQSADICGF